MIKRKAPLSLLVTLDSISKNTLDFFVSLVYNDIVCRYSSSVECQLPKLERGVRFPLPAFFSI